MCLYCDSKIKVKKSLCAACRLKIEKGNYTQQEEALLDLIEDNFQVEVEHPPPIWKKGVHLPLPKGLNMYPDEELFPKYKGRSILVDGRPTYVVDEKHKMQNQSHQMMLAGFAIAGFDIGVLDTSLAGVMDALRVRGGLRTEMVFDPAIGPELVVPDERSFLKAYEVFKYLKDEWGIYGKVEQMSDEEWLKTQRRQVQLRAVLEESQYKPISQPMVCKSFGKSEKKLFSKKSSNDPLSTVRIYEAKPRLIQGYPEDWLTYVGPFVKTVQHRIEEMFPVDCALHYAGADTPEQLNKWLRDVVPMRQTHWFICIDYAMFDCTHSSFSFDFVEKMYMDLVEPNDREELSMAEALKQMRWPQGLLKGILKYKAGKIMNGSGRPDTSVANISNSLLCLVISIASILFDVDPWDVTVWQIMETLEVIRVIGSGDDSVCVVPTIFRGAYLAIDLWMEKMPRAIATFGFLAKVEPNPTFDEMVFLGNRAYPHQNGDSIEWTWGPTIGRRLVKHHHLHQCNQDPVAVLHGIADMEAVCYPHVPILHDMALATLDILKGQKFNYYQDKDAEFKVNFTGGIDQSAKARAMGLATRYKTAHYDEVTLRHVCDVYQVSMESLLDCIQYVKSKRCLPCVLSHSVLTAVALKDN